MSDAVAIWLAVALLAANAFFVGAEFALVSARRTQVEPRAAEGSWPARITVRAMDKVSLMMAGAQLGITMCSLGLGAIGEPAVAHQLEKPLAAVGVTGPWLHGIAFAVALLIVIALHMVLGEMVPKNMAIASPERAAILLGPAMYGVVLALKPLIVSLNWISNGVLRLLRVKPIDELASAFDADQVAAFVAESREQGLLDESEHRVMAGSLSLSFESVSEVMTPTSELVTLPVGVTPQQALKECVRTGFSRFPVVDTHGAYVGYLHLKDFVDLPRGVVDLLPGGRVEHHREEVGVEDTLEPPRRVGDAFEHVLDALPRLEEPARRGGRSVRVVLVKNHAPGIVVDGALPAQPRRG